MIAEQNINFKTLARQISIVENELPTYFEILTNLSFQNKIPVIGITGPPGAGKSTLLNALVKHLTKKDNIKIAIIAVDPSSPFNYGSILGDRIRMQAVFNNPNIFIRSVASRGSLGGLSAKIIEIVDVIKSKGFDYIFVETVGVGQSEVEIAGLADVTVVTLTPNSGDDIQMIKAGILEIADIFAINKADLPGYETLHSFLSKIIHQNYTKEKAPTLVKTIASENIGIDELLAAIEFKYHNIELNDEKKAMLLTEKAIKLLQNKFTKRINKLSLIKFIQNELKKNNFQLYKFVQHFNSIS